MSQENKASPWHPGGFKAYANSDYSYDDATLLAQLWNIPLSEAKQAIGHKIIHKLEDLLPQKVKDQYAQHLNEGDGDYHYGNEHEQKALDAFFQSDYDYDDAALLAQIWGIEVGAAKSAIGYKILSKTEYTLPKEVREGASPDGEEICSEPENIAIPFGKSPITIDLSQATINIKSLKIREINIYHEHADDDD